jgi:hypothetical protein
MAVPQTKQIIALALPSAEYTRVKLPVPTRGVITRLVVWQADGVLAGFDFNTFDREDACNQVTENTDNPNDGRFYGDPELHRLQANQVVASAADVSSQLSLSIPYENCDEQDAVTRRLTDAVYLDIQPAGTLAKDFNISITVTVDTLA